MTVDPAADLLFRIRAGHNANAKPLTDYSPRERRRSLTRHLRLSHRDTDDPHIDVRPIHVPAEFDGVTP